MMSKRCEKCGREMPDGSLAYEVRIQVLADFDGHLSEAEATREETDARLREVLAQAAEHDPVALMREVYHAEQHLLCPGCRDRYLANPLNLPHPDERA